MEDKELFYTVVLKRLNKHWPYLGKYLGLVYPPYSFGRQTVNNVTELNYR